MRAENHFWTIVGFVVAFVIGFPPLYVAYDIYGRGSLPEKHLQRQTIGPTDLKSQLRIYGSEDRVRLSVTINDQTVDNLSMINETLTNVGASPILPSEYHEKLSANVKKPWKIVAMDNREWPRDISLRWTRINEQRFEADPALINPGDQVATIIYVTNAEPAASSTAGEKDEPRVEWGVRITNLHRIEQAPDRFTEMQNRYKGIYVQLSGWSLPFTIAVAILFQALYLHLLVRAGWLRGWGWLTITLVLATSILSFAGAECIATYLFGNNLTDYIGVNHRLNAPPVIVNIATLLVLARLSRTRPAGQLSQP